LLIQQSVGDTCSFTITDRVGTLQSTPSSCSSVVYYFQNDAHVSYWYLDFTSLTDGNDVFTFFDGPDLFAPVILQTSASKLQLDRPYMSTNSWLTLQVTRMSMDETYSTWSLQFTNYEENSALSGSPGYQIQGEEDVYVSFDQSMTGVTEDYVGSTWVIDPYGDYIDFGLEVSFHLKSLQDTTGTLRIIVQYAGNDIQVYGAGDVGKIDEWFYYPDSAYDAKIIVHSQVRTQPGSYSSFSFAAGTDQWWSYSSSSWWSSSSSGHHFGFHLIIIGVLLGFGLVVGAIIALVWCARRRKKAQVPQYNRLDMNALPQNKALFHQGQPIYVMMSPPGQQPYAVPIHHGAVPVPMNPVPITPTHV
jgi:hypothetical protein